ncbi:alpha/beta hydrolase [Williamsia maris]|uniref:Lipase n=2 Tax=Williamsia maris TaxID=72806 RepID=A0ABT1HHW1_9NOCA|nr:lipase [Williamsia maris]
MISTMTALTVPVFGPADGTTVLALHGLTGHGKRWTNLANDHLPELRIVAPDLLGHGHSSWDAPWTIEAQVAAIIEVLDTHVDGPVVVVGHSFGGALAIHLSRAEPSRVSGLVLLDPAIGLDGAFLSEVAAANLDSWYLRDRQDARDRKRAEAWWEVPDALLEAEIAEHLLVAADGRMSWRVHPSAVATTWSELARPHVMPAPGIDVRLVVADKVQPPYAPAPFIDELTAQQGERFILHHEDCDHMVPLSRPELTARLVRDAVASVAAG